MSTRQPKFFDTISTAAFGATAPTQQSSDKNIFTGNGLLYELYLTITHVITHGTGSGATTDGELLLEDGIFIETDKHGPIVDGVDGLGLHRIQQFLQGTRPLTTAIAAVTGSYTTALRIPFAFTNGYRPYDTAIDMLRSRMTVRINYTDLSKGIGTVGTDTDAPQADISGLITYGPDERPSDQGGELPEWMPYFFVKKFPITATATGDRLMLPYGDRVYLMLFVSQRLLTTYAELNNTVITSTGRVSLDVNGVNWVDRLQWRELQGYNKSHFGLEAQPTGWGVLDFWSKSGRLRDAAPTLDDKAGYLNLVVDDTSVANGSLWVYGMCVKRIPVGAKRAA